jgi:hypothetical protein
MAINVTHRSLDVFPEGDHKRDTSLACVTIANVPAARNDTMQDVPFEHTIPAEASLGCE